MEAPSPAALPPERIGEEEMARRLLAVRGRLAIVAHLRPDGDAVGASLGLCRALRDAGRDAVCVGLGPVSDVYDFLEGLDAIVPAADFVPRPGDTLAVLDCGDPSRLREELRPLLAAMPVLCIDHHEINRVDAPLKCVDPHASSNCEILFELFAEMGVPIDADTAACIYTGVATDTGCFKYSNTTSKTLRIAAELLDLGVDAPAINKVMFDTKTKKKLLIEREAYNSLTYCAGDRCAIIAVTQDMMKKAGVNDDELEGLASIPRQIEGVEIGITMREKEPNVFKISVRANERLVNAAQFCARFGGGGHAAAAGCRIKGTLAEVTAKLRETAEELL